MDLKTKENLSKGLYIFASIIMLINIYQMAFGEPTKFIEIGSWVLLLIAAMYGTQVEKEKKKLEDGE